MLLLILFFMKFSAVYILNDTREMDRSVLVYLCCELYTDITTWKLKPVALLNK